MLGGVLLVAGIVVTVLTMRAVETQSGGRYVLAVGPVIGGLGLIVHAVSDLAGYRSFVAWRYLLNAQHKVSRRVQVLIGVGLFIYVALQVTGFAPFSLGSPLHIVAVVNFAVLGLVVFWGVLRHSRPAMVAFLVGVLLIVISLIGTRLAADNKLPFMHLGEEQRRAVLAAIGIVGIAGGVLLGLATFFGGLRAFFTFFTTVPIGGVWIGTAALVCVLAVMSGFESDLREKILGSNAHIQITREDGEFVDWRAAKAKIDAIPGVVASTPYAVSEVVIAAHNNGMNVIIKGIDPATVGGVTDLISDLEDKQAIERLAPLVDDTEERVVPQDGPRPTDVVDPAPDDLPLGADPIDFSGAPAPPDAPAVPPDAAPVPTPAAAPGALVEPPAGYGGDAIAVLGEAGTAPEPAAVVDPAPADLLTSDAAPEDFSASDGGDPDFDPDGEAIDVVDLPAEPTLSRRTLALPGVLVGRELVKQTHLYTGEEVRIVSPLSDPSNPDATGTPIPFNRDYRVAGVFFTGMYEYDLKYVYVTLESLQDFLDRGEAIDGIEVRITDADDTERYIPTAAGAGKIREALGPGYRIVDWRELNRSLFSALKLEKIAMFLVLGIVILVASFSIVGNLIMVVVEKGRQIALLKTLGASNFGVMQLFAIQGLMIGLIGTLLGVLTGLLGCWAGKRFGLPLNPDVYYIDRLPIHVDPESVAAAALAGIVISILATLYPALLAARVRPSAGMRH